MYGPYTVSGEARLEQVRILTGTYPLVICRAVVELGNDLLAAVFGP